MIILGVQFLGAQIRTQAFQTIADNNSSHYGVGISAQHSLYGNQRFLPGASIGVNYEFNAFDDHDVISVPIELILRQYLYGRHSCCGGGYVEAMGGAKFTPFVRNARSSDKPSTMPIASIGLGYRTGMSYDISLYYGANFEKNKVGSIVGIKLGYNL